jgi:hypothetical protein
MTIWTHPSAQLPALAVDDVAANPNAMQHATEPRVLKSRSAPGDIEFPTSHQEEAYTEITEACCWGELTT